MTAEEVGEAAAALATGLARAGVRYAVICPGSRSTPFALALHRHPGIQVLMHYDERSAGYFALGLARGLSEPAAVLTTSGTAAGNLVPAVMEAYYTGVPLVVLTADRPPELRQAGAPQTVDQVKLFGDSVKHFHEMPVPDAAVSPRQWARAGERAAREAIELPAGPVHVNLPVREPLLPVWPSESLAPDESGRSVPRSHPPRLHFPDLRDWAGGEARGVVVAGAQNLLGSQRTVFRIASELGWPVWADPLSNLRGRGETVLMYDWLSRDLPDELRPRKVLRVGPLPTSKAANQALLGVPTAVLDAPGWWRDPEASVTHWFDVDLDDLDGQLAEPASQGPQSPWQEAWAAWDQVAGRLVQAALRQAPDNFQGRWASELGAVVAPKTTVMVGNSLPVRDAEQYFAGSSSVVLFGNRGASGIDGVASTGLGLARARQEPLLLVVGDLSFLHDLNGWLAAHLHQIPAVVLVIDNRGGGIFSTLGQEQLPHDQFELLFGTPHHLDFSGAAALFGGGYRRAATWAEARAAVQAAQQQGGIQIVNWTTLDRHEHARVHAQLVATVVKGLAAERGGRHALP